MKNFVLLIFILMWIGACTKKEAAPNSSNALADQVVQRGKNVYIANCIACHNVNPQQDGPVGPAIAGSSLELIRARVLKAEYPPGYKPKRETRQMIAFPQLESEIPNLHAYLNSGN